VPGRAPRGVLTSTTCSIGPSNAFWRHGYEGASLQVLTGAMGINQDQHVRDVRLQAGPVLPRGGALRGGRHGPTRGRRSTGRPRTTSFAPLLRDNADAPHPGPAGPPAACSIQGGVSCGPGKRRGQRVPGGQQARGASRPLADRLARARSTDGDLPATTDPAALARFVMVFAEGQAVHAAPPASSAKQLREGRRHRTGRLRPHHH